MDDEFPDFGSTAGDVIYDPVLESNLWIVVASQPLTEGTTSTQWVDDVLGSTIAGLDSCDPPIEPVTIDGNQGRRCGSPAAAVAAGGRGYAVLLYVSGDDPAVAAMYDQAYFDEILATLRLQPEDAVVPCRPRRPEVPRGGVAAARGDAPQEARRRRRWASAGCDDQGATRWIDSAPPTIQAGASLSWPSGSRTVAPSPSRTMIHRSSGDQNAPAAWVPS